MRAPTLLPALLLLAAPLLAQDQMTTIDGKVLTVKVSAMDAIEVRYKPEGSAAEKILSREKIGKLELRQSRITSSTDYRRALRAEAEENWGEAEEYYRKAAEKAEKSKDIQDFAPQYLYWKAYEIARAQNAREDAADLLAALEKTKAKHFYVPILLLRQARNDMAVANERAELEKAKAGIASYQQQVKDLGLGERYGYYGELFMTLIRARLKEIDVDAAQAAFAKILQHCEGVYPDLVNRLNVEVAYSSLNAGRFDDARKLFSGIVQSDSADEETLARAYLGRGHTWLKAMKATPEEAQKALADYMRVAILYPDTDDEIVGEALYHADNAYRIWNGPNARVNRGRILGRLKGRYAETSWAKK
ncbi:MAG: hypothetical protein R3F30_13790 [Planctomycetota bacterium]